MTTGTARISPRTTTWVLVLAALASLMAALDAMVVSSALTTIRLDLGASIGQLEWTANAYNLSLGVLLLPAAALGDRLGRRRMFTLGLAVFVAASAGCAMAPDAGWLIAVRTLQGASAALVVPNALALVGAAFSSERRGAALGILQGSTGVAVVAGPVIGGAVAQGLAWEWIFWLNVPIGLAAIPLALAHMPESVGSDTKLDLGGVGLVTGGALGIVWGLVRGNAAGWSSPEVTTTLVLGFALLAAFVAWERRAREPMLPMRLFRSRAFSFGNAGMFFLFASLFGALFFLPQFLQTSLGQGPLETALRLGPWTGTLFVVAPIAGALVDRIGARPLLVGGLGLQGAGMAWLALIAEPGLAYAAMIAPLVIAGIGASMAIPPAASSVLGAVAPNEVGKAAGANSMLRGLGGVFGIAVMVAVFAGAGSYASSAAFSHGFAAAIAVSAALSLAGAIAGLGLPRHHRASAKVTPQGTPTLEPAGAR